jgi:hypothetical protein
MFVMCLSIHFDVCALFLELDDVEAEKQPGAVWAVYVGLPPGSEPDSKSPYYVGVLSLFGARIRSEAPHGFKPP